MKKNESFVLQKLFFQHMELFLTLSHAHVNCGIAMFLVTCKASISQVNDNIMIMKVKSRLLSVFLTSNEPNLESRDFCFACGETIQVYPLDLALHPH